MSRFYPDTNVIHELCSALTPAEFDLKAQTAGLRLCLGHQTYELARSFLYDHPQGAVKRAFTFLSEVRCIEFLPDVNHCIEAEAYLAQAGIALVTVVDPLNQVATRQELMKLARGNADDACAFISKRENNIAIDKMKVTKQNQSAAEQARAIDRQRARQVKTFELLQRELKAGRAEWLKKFLQKNGQSLTISAINRILNDPSRFPLLNTIVNSQEYLYFISAFHRTSPGKDTLDDFRHLVESAWADKFVTKETNLLHQAAKICPFKACVSWQEFKCVFHLA